MSNKLPNGSQFADRRQPQQKPTNEQLQAQQTAQIAQMRLNLSTQFLNTLIPIAQNAQNGDIPGTAKLAIDYADELLIGLGIAQRVEEKSE